MFTTMHSLKTVEYWIEIKELNDSWSANIFGFTSLHFHFKHAAGDDKMADCDFFLTWSEQLGVTSGLRIYPFKTVSHFDWRNYDIFRCISKLKNVAKFLKLINIWCKKLKWI